MSGFIYLTTNNITGMKYIGKRQTNWGKNIIDSYLGSNAYLKKDIKRYGADNFSRVILEYANSNEELRLLEIKYLEQYNVVDDEKFYNLAIPSKENKFGFLKIKRHPEAVAKTANKTRGQKRNKYHMRVKFRNLTSEKLDEILKLHHKGLTPYQIQEKIKYSAESITKLLKGFKLTPNKIKTGALSRWTKEQSNELIDMYNSGLSCSAIASRTNRQIGVVSKQLKKLGYTIHDANHYKQITEEHSNKIVSMYNDGYTYSQISKEIGKCTQIVSRHLKNLGFGRRKQSTFKK